FKGAICKIAKNAWDNALLVNAREQGESNE
ncbi:unnamed protein product, partial [marine sediment metagenome]